VRIAETESATVKVMIATPLEEELVRKIEGTDARLEVLYDSTLLPSPRYPSDHKGDPSFRRDVAGERRWEQMLEGAEVLFGIPGDSPEMLREVIRRAPRVEWIQATSAGAGEQVRAAGLSPEELHRVTVTTSSGIHAGPLAEFCLFGILAFTKGLPRLLRDKQEKHWDHYPTRELKGTAMLIVGLGKIGLEVARLARSFGMRTIGLKRHPDAELPHVDELHPSEDLKELVPRADAVVVTLPLTERTEGMVDQEAISLMKPGCVFVNVGRGGVVDEEALIESLENRRIAGAALDVFATEPLPPESPLWDLPNVLISPHTAALAESENERIVELFQKNLRLYLQEQPLFNRVDPQDFY
jgi:phosphoglycerate dehydrogenase-like enzyme